MGKQVELRWGCPGGTLEATNLAIQIGLRLRIPLEAKRSISISRLDVRLQSIRFTIFAWQMGSVHVSFLIFNGFMQLLCYVVSCRCKSLYLPHDALLSSLGIMGELSGVYAVVQELAEEVLSLLMLLSLSW